MKIGELARRTGLPSRTIRFYESAGVLAPPPRTDSGYRSYAAADAERLEFIMKARSLGLSLREIGEVLRIHDRHEPTCVHVRALLDDKLAQLDRLLRNLQEFRAELAALRQRLGDVLDCRPTGGRICAIIEGAPLGARPQVLDWLGPRRRQGPARAG
ncbi:MAG: heavy metal-responsive transcriptional regulator [Chloroflexi bacterium]|nr:heavy metal-responsive transcriptional regulator [Chloroflexota bacterium]